MKQNWLVPGFFFLVTVLICVWIFRYPVNANQPVLLPSSTVGNSKSKVTIQHVQIRDIGTAPRVYTDEINVNGNPVTVSCTTCHQTRTPNVANKTGDDLDEFHQGLTMQHGDLSCLSCHNSENYDTLRLSDGREVQYKGSIQLCAQCHGTQYRDYQHGAHGGMTGYWSLEKGNRLRNHCLHCHDPHYLKYQMMHPVHPTNYRFLNQHNDHE